MTSDDNDRDSVQGQSADPVGEPAQRSKSGTSKGGAPKANTNAMRHGLNCSTLPKGCRGIERQVAKLRSEAERAARADGRDLGLLELARINLACRWHAHGLLAARWLRLHVETMDHDQRLAYSREVVKAAAERDKALSGIGTAAPDDWSQNPMNAQLRTYRSDPAAFVLDIMAELGLNVAPCQEALVRQMAPSLLAVADGRKPPVGKLWLEAVKGWGKSLIVALFTVWLLAFAPGP